MMQRGLRASAGKIKLDNPKNNFERGATDVFTVGTRMSFQGVSRGTWVG